MNIDSILKKVPSRLRSVPKRVYRKLTDIYYTWDFRKNIRKYKDIHCGEDCILMGAGPSLREIPTSLLTSYRVIGTNGSYKHYLPDYHVVIDPQATWLSELRKILAANSRPFFICWAWVREVYRRRHRNELKIPWLWMSTELEEEKNPDLRQRIIDVVNDPDLIEKTGFTSSLSVVPEAAIPLAFYMGFRRIYLAGLDWGPGHFYEDNKKDAENTKTFRTNLSRKYGIENIDDVLQKKRWGMEVMAETNKRDRIFNLSLNSRIQNIPKVHYSELLP